MKNSMAQINLNKNAITVIIIFTAIFFLSGCATYKFHHGKPPYDKGYVVSRDDYTILEYTLGRDNTVPKLKLAKERFKRRSNTVEDYYKRMGLIQNHFTMVTWEPCMSFLKIVVGVFRLPLVALSDYRYEHNPKYKEKIKKLEAEQDLRAENRIKTLKEKLNAYIQQDLAQKEPDQGIKDEIAKESLEAPEKEVQITKLPESPVEEKPKLSESEVKTLPQATSEQKSQEIKTEPPTEIFKESAIQEKEQTAAETETKKEISIEHPVKTKEKVASKKQKTIPEIEKKATKPAKLPVAVIIAKPTKGLSPLKVQFYANKSNAPGGRIIHYAWDFGDGDTSTKMNPINTYFSGSLEPRYYTVTLTVHDDKGNSATASTTIEVVNK